MAEYELLEMDGRTAWFGSTHGTGHCTKGILFMRGLLYFKSSFFFVSVPASQRRLHYQLHFCVLLSLFFCKPHFFFFSFLIASLAFPVFQYFSLKVKASLIAGFILCVFFFAPK